MKRVKRIILLPLLIVSLLCMALGFMNFSVASADSVEEPEGNFSVVGASVRISLEEASLDGIRFRTVIDQQKYEDFVSLGAETCGTLIIPKKIFDATDADEVLDIDTLHVLKYENPLDVYTFDEDASMYVSVVCIYDFPSLDSVHVADLLVRSYIKVGDQYFYSDSDEDMFMSSFAYVATYSVKNNPEYTEEQQARLNGYRPELSVSLNGEEIVCRWGDILEREEEGDGKIIEYEVGGNKIDISQPLTGNMAITTNEYDNPVSNISGADVIVNADAFFDLDEEYSVKIIPNRWYVDFGVTYSGEEEIDDNEVYEFSVMSATNSTARKSLYYLANGAAPSANDGKVFVTDLNPNTKTTIYLSGEQLKNLQAGTACLRYTLYDYGGGVRNTDPLYLTNPKASDKAFSSQTTDGYRNYFINNGSVGLGGVEVDSWMTAGGWAANFYVHGNTYADGYVTFYIYPTASRANMALSSKNDYADGRIIWLTANQWNEVTMPATTYNDYVTNHKPLYITNGASVSNVTFYFSAVYNTPSEAPMNIVTVSSGRGGYTTADKYDKEFGSYVVNATGWKCTMKLTKQVTDPSIATVSIFVKSPDWTKTANWAPLVIKFGSTDYSISFVENEWNEIQLSVETYNSYVSSGTDFIIQDGNNGIVNKTFYFSDLYLTRKSNYIPYYEDEQLDITSTRVITTSYLDEPRGNDIAGMFEVVRNAGFTSVFTWGYSQEWDELCKANGLEYIVGSDLKVSNVTNNTSVTAVSAIYYADEPWYANIDGELQDIIETHNAYYASSDFAVCLLPYYNGAENQTLATTENGVKVSHTYEEYVKYYFENVVAKIPYNRVVGVDYYPLLQSGNVDEWWTLTLGTVSRYCKMYDAEFQVYVNCTKFKSGIRGATQENLRWMANVALSFGAKGIRWYTLADYKNTEQTMTNRNASVLYAPYEYVTNVNNEIANLSTVLGDFEFDGVMQVTGVNSNPNNNNFNRTNYYGVSNTIDSIEGVSSISASQQTLVGKYYGLNGELGLYITNFADPDIYQVSDTVTIVFNSPINKALVYTKIGGKSTQTLTNNTLTITINKGEGVFVVPYQYETDVYVHSVANNNFSVDYSRAYGSENRSFKLDPTAWASTFKFTSVNIPSDANYVEFYVYAEGAANNNLAISTSSNYTNKIGNYLVPGSWNKFEMPIATYNNYVSNETTLYFTDGSNVSSYNFYFSEIQFKSLTVAPTSLAVVSESSAHVYGDDTESLYIISKSWAFPFVFGKGIEIPSGTDFIKLRVYVDGDKSNLALSTTSSYVNGRIMYLTGNAWNTIAIDATTFSSYITNETILYITNGESVNNLPLYFSSIEFCKYEISASSTYATTSISLDRVYGEEEFSTKLTPASWELQFGFNSDIVVPSGANYVEFYIYVEGSRNNLALSRTNSYTNDRIMYLTCNAWNKVQLTIDELNTYSDGTNKLHLTNGGDGFGSLRFYFSSLSFVSEYININKMSRFEYSTTNVYGDEEKSICITPGAWRVQFTFANNVTVPSGSDYAYFYVYLDGSSTETVISTNGAVSNAVTSKFVPYTWTLVAFPIATYNGYVSGSTDLSFTNGNNFNGMHIYLSELHFGSNYITAGASTVSIATNNTYGDEALSTLVVPNGWAGTFGFNSSISVPDDADYVEFSVYPNGTKSDLAISTTSNYANKITKNFLTCNAWNTIRIAKSDFVNYKNNGTLLYITNGDNVANLQCYFSGLRFGKFEITNDGTNTLSVANNYVASGEFYSTKLAQSAWKVQFGFSSSVEVPEGTKYVVFNVYPEGNVSNLALSTTSSYVNGRITWLTCGAWNTVSLTIDQFNTYSDGTNLLCFTNGDNVSSVKFYFSALHFSKGEFEVTNGDRYFDTSRVYEGDDCSTKLDATAWKTQFRFSTDIVVPTGANYVEFYIYTEGSVSNLALSTTSSYADGRITWLTCNDWTKVELTIEQFNAYANGTDYLTITNGDNVSNLNFYFSELTFSV